MLFHFLLQPASRAEKRLYRAFRRMRREDGGRRRQEAAGFSALRGLRGLARFAAQKVQQGRAEKQLYRAFRRKFGIRRITPAKSRRLIRPTRAERHPGSVRRAPRRARRRGGLCPIHPWRHGGVLICHDRRVLCGEHGGAGFEGGLHLPTGGRTTVSWTGHPDGRQDDPVCAADQAVALSRLPYLSLCDERLSNAPARQGQGGAQAAFGAVGQGDVAAVGAGEVAGDGEA